MYLPMLDTTKKQPFFNSVYRSNENMVSDDYKNEKIFGIEVGYGFRSSIFDANVNLYRTSWRDRYDRKSNLREDATNTRYYAELNGIAEIHQGVEVDAALKLGRVLSVMVLSLSEIGSIKEMLMLLCLMKQIMKTSFHKGKLLIK